MYITLRQYWKLFDFYFSRQCIEHHSAVLAEDNAGNDKKELKSFLEQTLKLCEVSKSLFSLGLSASVINQLQQLQESVFNNLKINKISSPEDLSFREFFYRQLQLFFLVYESANPGLDAKARNIIQQQKNKILKEELPLLKEQIDTYRKEALLPSYDDKSCLDLLIASAHKFLWTDEETVIEHKKESEKLKRQDVKEQEGVVDTGTGSGFKWFVDSIRSLAASLSPTGKPLSDTKETGETVKNIAVTASDKVDETAKNAARVLEIEADINKLFAEKQVWPGLLLGSLTGFYLDAFKLDTPWKDEFIVGGEEYYPLVAVRASELQQDLEATLNKSLMRLRQINKKNEVGLKGLVDSFAKLSLSMDALNKARFANFQSYVAAVTRLNAEKSKLEDAGRQRLSAENRVKKQLVKSKSEASGLIKLNDLEKDLNNHLEVQTARSEYATTTASITETIRKLESEINTLMQEMQDKKAQLEIDKQLEALKSELCATDYKDLGKELEKLTQNSSKANAVTEVQISSNANGETSSSKSLSIEGTSSFTNTSQEEQQLTGKISCLHALKEICAAIVRHEQSFINLLINPRNNGHQIEYQAAIKNIQERLNKIKEIYSLFLVQRDSKTPDIPDIEKQKANTNADGSGRSDSNVERKTLERKSDGSEVLSVQFFPADEGLEFESCLFQIHLMIESEAIIMLAFSEEYRKLLSQTDLLKSLPAYKTRFNFGDEALRLCRSVSVAPEAFDSAPLMLPAFNQLNVSSRTVPLIPSLSTKVGIATPESQPLLIKGNTPST